jgi:hypothetical protein
MAGLLTSTVTLTVFSSIDLAHEVELHDVLLEVGFDDAGKRGADGFLGDGHGGAKLPLKQVARLGRTRQGFF